MSHFRGYGSNPTKHWPCDYWFNEKRRCRNPAIYQSSERTKDGYIPYYCWCHIEK